LVILVFRMMSSKEHSKAWYRIGTTRFFSGSKKIKPQLSLKLKQVSNFRKYVYEANYLKLIQIPVYGLDKILSNEIEHWGLIN